jgi:hypothetical protein
MYASPQQPIQFTYFAEDSLAMLSEEADKLLEKLVRELGYEILTGYTAKTSRPSFTIFLPSDEDFSPT